MGAKVVGVSVDHVPCLTAWAESLDGISFPLLSDFWPHGSVARLYDVFREPDGHSERAVFVIDAEGRITYADVHDIDEAPDNEVLFAELEKAGAGPAVRDPASESPPAVSASPPPAGTLLMYCTKWCPDCRAARRWLNDRGIEYVEVDVTADPEARERAASFNEGRLHTPTFEVVETEDVCVDFDPERLELLLGMR